MKLEFGGTSCAWGQETFVVILKTEGNTHYLYPFPELFDNFLEDDFPKPEDRKPVPRSKEDVRILGSAEIIPEEISEEELRDITFLLQFLAINIFWCVPSKIDTEFTDKNVDSIQISFCEGSLDDPVRIVNLGENEPSAIDTGEHPFYVIPHPADKVPNPYRKCTEIPDFSHEFAYKGNQDESTKKTMNWAISSLGITPGKFNSIKQINIQLEKQDADKITQE